MELEQVPHGHGHVVSILKNIVKFFGTRDI